MREPKEKTREQLDSSPDKGDSLVLTFVVGPLRRKTPRDVLTTPKHRRLPAGGRTGWHAKLHGRR